MIANATAAMLGLCRALPDAALTKLKEKRQTASSKIRELARSVRQNLRLVAQSNLVKLVKSTKWCWHCRRLVENCQPKNRILTSAEN